MAVWIVAAALAAVAVGAAAGWWLLRGKRAVALEEAGAGTAADAALPGFSTKAVLIGDDRRAAVVVAHGTRVAVVEAAGRPKVREVRWRDIRAIPGGLCVEVGSRTVFVAGVDVLEVRRAGGDDWKPA